MAACKKWEVRFFAVFAEQYKQLAQEVLALRGKDPTGYKTHPQAKLLKAVHNAVFVEVPTDPMAKRYLLGGTLGAHNKHWKRVKNGLPQRHRLFFQYLTKKCEIVYAWFSLDGQLRKEGDTHDVYAVMKHLLNSGTIPTKYSELAAKSAPPTGKAN